MQKLPPRYCDCFESLLLNWFDIEGATAQPISRQYPSRAIICTLPFGYFFLIKCVNSQRTRLSYYTWWKASTRLPLQLQSATQTPKCIRHLCLAYFAHKKCPTIRFKQEYEGNLIRNFNVFNWMPAHSLLISFAACCFSSPADSCCVRWRFSSSYFSSSAHRFVRRSWHKFGDTSCDSPWIWF